MPHPWLAHPRPHRRCWGRLARSVRDDQRRQLRHDLHRWVLADAHVPCRPISTAATAAAAAIATAAIALTTAAIALSAALTALAAAAAAAELPRRALLSCDAGHTDLGK